MTNVLITGATGFVGGYLIKYLSNQNVKIFATYRKNPSKSTQDMINRNLENTDIPIVWLKCEITDLNNVEAVLKKSKPNIIFHLASQSVVSKSWLYPIMTIQTNVIGTLNVLEVIKLNDDIDPIIHIPGSCEEYGMVHENETPVVETNPLRPLSPYGVSKVAADKLALQYYKSYGLKTIVTRAFNHTGPGRPKDYVVSNFCYQVAQILKGKKEFLECGNLNAIRDFTDVRDIVRAYWLAVNNCEFGDVYNIASGRKVKIGSIIEILEEISGITIEIKENPERMRPSDVIILVGNSNKFRKKTNWKPTISFKQTVEDILNYWLNKV